MKKYWFIALVALAAGCKTTDHQQAHEQRPPPPPQQTAAAPMHGNMGPIMMQDGMGPMRMGMRGNAGVIYYHEASQRLMEARQAGYLTNEEFAKLLGELQGDLRQIMVAEAHSWHPEHPMMMQKPMHHPPPQERGRGHEREHGHEEE